MNSEDNSLEGQLLIAMPQMPDPRFSKSVIYICSHTQDGAMGIVINKPADSIDVDQLLQQLEITNSNKNNNIGVYFGGPVEASRGFVLHSTDYMNESTLLLGNGFALTETIEVINSIASGEGPSKSILALGYAGWEKGQLDVEIKNNGWLIAPADTELVFDTNNSDKWEFSAKRIGINIEQISSDLGHA